MNTIASAKRWLPLIFLGGLIAAVFAFDLDRYLSLEALRDNRDTLRALVDDHTLATAAGFVLAYAAVIALSLPGATVMTLAGGFLFGTCLGASLNVVSATAGAAVLFFIARSAIGDALRDRAGPFLKRMEEGFRRDAFNYLLFLRLVPAFPFWAVNLAPALLGMRAAPYVAATMIGIVPGTVVYTAFGAGLGQIFDADADASLRGILSPTLLAALVGLGFLALLPIVVRRVRERTTGRAKAGRGG